MAGYIVRQRMVTAKAGQLSKGGVAGKAYVSGADVPDDYVAVAPRMVVHNPVKEGALNKAQSYR